MRVYFLLMKARYGQYFKLENLLSPSPGGETGGIPQVNFYVVGGITRVYFSSDVGKILAIIKLEDPLSPSPDG
jgi:hypothetical protein